MGGICGNNERQKDRMKDEGERVNGPVGCFNELISKLLRIKREEQMALQYFRAPMT